MKLRSLFAATAVVAGALCAPLAFAQPIASSDPCVGSWSIGVGGFELGGGTNSAYINADQRVGYNTYDPAGGKNELNRLFWDHRNQCPGDHIKLIGHSEGAGIVHSWVTENQGVDNANAVLLADPKRFGGDTGVGLAQFGQPWFPGYPLTGVDDWFGAFPVLQVCRWDDGICRTDAGPGGYFAGTHGWYDFSAWSYGDWDNGTVMVG